MTKRKNRLIATISLAVVTVAVGAISLLGQSGGQGIAPDPEGTWRVTVTPDDGRPDVLAYHTYSRGGTFLESNTLGPTVGHGVWERRGPRTFGFTFEKFVLTPTGVLVGRAVIREVIELDPSGDSSTGRGQAQLFDMSGNRLDNFCARTRAVRMSVQPPDCR